jgi:hypothetical protein
MKAYWWKALVVVGAVGLVVFSLAHFAKAQPKLSEITRMPAFQPPRAGGIMQPNPNIQQISPSVLRDNIKGIFKPDSCQGAIATYKAISEQAIAKAEICRAMENNDLTSEKERAIYWRLFDMMSPSKVPGGYNSTCYAYINTYREQAWNNYQTADVAFWDYWEKCHFEGPSLAILNQMQGDAAAVVCEKCGSWPQELMTGNLLFDLYRCGTSSGDLGSMGSAEPAAPVAPAASIPR